MPKVYQASNVDEAVDIAHRLKKNGYYDWFRGQTSLKPPRSTFFRACDDAERLAETKRQYMRFFRWLKESPQLKYLDALKHEPMAILQHYGIPTNYIDFTTDPSIAGFFACDTKYPPFEPACIYCLDSNDVIRFWKKMRSLMQPGMLVEKVEIDVKNLWRLQAQKGVFLLCNFNWDQEYPMDRIEFPRTGMPIEPKRSVIYPEEKSPLENILDQFFQLHRQSESIDDMVKQLKKIPGFKVLDMGAKPDGYLTSSFQQEVTILESWSPDSIDGWLIEPIEQYQVPGSIPIDLTGCKTPGEIGHAVTAVVTKAMQDSTELRDVAIEWPIINASSNELAKCLSNTLRRVWNGLRVYPYTATDIIDSMDNTARLQVESLTHNGRSVEQILASYMPNPHKIGFSYYDGSGGISYASVDSLHNAMRPDLIELLVEEHRKRVESVVDIFPMLFRPWRMFEFEPFTELFAREVIPVQAVFGDDDLIVFNPARLIAFGEP